MLVITDGEGAEHEHGGAKSLLYHTLPVALEVRSRVGGEDAGRVVTVRREDRSTGDGVFGIPGADSGSVVEVDDGSADETAEELREELAGKLAPLFAAGADDGRHDRDGGVD